MASNIREIADTMLEPAPEENLNYYPASQINGSDWIIDALNDLAKYCSFNQLDDIEITLQRTIWEASLQLRQAKSKATDT